MTLVAAWKQNSVPVMIGDVLVTRDMSSKSNAMFRHKSIPTRDDLIEILPPTDGVQVEESRQKLSIIYDDLCVGFSGDVEPAVDVINSLKFRFGAGGADYQSLKRFLRTVTDKTGTTVHLVGWFRQDGDCRTFRWNSSVPSLFRVGESEVIGMGSPAFKRLKGEIGNPFTADPIEIVVGLVGRLLSDETLYKKNTQERFGGAYSIVIDDGERFRYCNEVLYGFLPLRRTSDPKQLLGMIYDKWFKSSQNSEMLEVLALNTRDGGVGSHERSATGLVGYEMFYVPPATASNGDIFPVNGNLPLTSEYYCFSLDVTDAEDKEHPEDQSISTQPLTWTFSERIRERYISICESQGIETLTLEPPFFDRIFRHLGMKAP